MSIVTPITVYYNVIDKHVQNADGAPLSGVLDMPSVRLGQKPWVNLLLVTDTENTPYHLLPAGTVANIICDSDYLNRSPILPLYAGDNWTASGDEYYYTGTISSKPLYVLEGNDELTEGEVGTLLPGEWAWSTALSRLFVRLTSDTDPDDSDSLTVYIQYDTTYTDPFFEVDGDTFNQASSWLEDGAYRNPDITDGEISFQINANTVQFWERLGSLVNVQTSTIQIELLAPSTAVPFDMIEFLWICRNKYVGGATILELKSINVYTKTETLALIAGIMAIHESTYDHEDIALNTADRHTQGGGGETNTDEKVKLNSGDETAGYLSDKLSSTFFEIISTVMGIKDACIGNTQIAADAGIELSKLEAQPDEVTIINDSGELKVADVPTAVKEEITGDVIDLIELVDLQDTSITAPADNDIGGWLSGVFMNIPGATFLLSALTKGIIEQKLTGEITTHSHSEQVAADNGVTTPASSIGYTDHGAVVTAVYDEDSATRPATLELLLHFTGGEGDTAIEDKSINERAVSPRGVSAYITAAQGVEDGSSLRVANGGIAIPYHADFNNPAGPFAVDLFFRPLDATPREIPLISIPSCLNLWLDYDGASSRLWISMLFDGESEWASMSYAVNMPSDNFRHFMLQLASGSLQVGFNGSVIDTIPVSNLTAFSSGHWYVGYHDIGDGDVHAYGYFDEVRYFSEAFITVETTTGIYTIPTTSYVTRKYDRSDTFVDVVELPFTQIDIDDGLLLVYHAQGTVPVNPQLLDPDDIVCDAPVRHYNNYFAVDMSDFLPISGTWSIRFRGNVRLSHVGESAVGDVRYVKHDATGDDDGTSWTDAFTDLQDALDAAVDGDQIWVAAGTYLPTEQLETEAPYDPLNKSFVIKCDVSVYGGFDGTELTLSERDHETNLTYLSNLVDTDVYGYGVIHDNGHTAMVDGFNIVEFANGTGWAHPSGVHVTGNANLTLRNCAITPDDGDFATIISGDGNAATTISLEDCVLTGDDAVDHNIYLRYTNIHVKDCELTAVRWDQQYGSCDIDGMNFHGVVVSLSHVFDIRYPVTACSIRNSTFHDNDADTNSVVYLYQPTTSATAGVAFINCTFAENIGCGRMLSSSLYPNTHLDACTLADNTFSFASVYAGYPGRVIATNTIFEEAIPVDVSVLYTCYDDGSPLLDPAGLQDNGGPVPTIALQEASPCVDAGSFQYAPVTDARGVARPQGLKIDIGAYELEQ